MNIKEGFPLSDSGRVRRASRLGSMVGKDMHRWRCPCLRKFPSKGFLITLAFIAFWAFFVWQTYRGLKSRVAFETETNEEKYVSGIQDIMNAVYIPEWPEYGGR
jgi:hypothetical protein